VASFLNPLCAKSQFAVGSNSPRISKGRIHCLTN
jgi:hypothetical protein